VREASTRPLAGPSAKSCAMTAPCTTATRCNRKLAITVSNSMSLVKRSLVGKCDVHMGEPLVTVSAPLLEDPPDALNRAKGMQ
jgi:hypothetical protein